MKKLVAVTMLLMSFTAMASENPCIKPAIDAVEYEFGTTPDLNPDVRQPKGSGVYQLVILKDECWFEVSVEMKKTSNTECSAVSTPELDENSANCG